MVMERAATAVMSCCFLSQPKNMNHEEHKEHKEISTKAFANDIANVSTRGFIPLLTRTRVNKQSTFFVTKVNYE